MCVCIALLCTHPCVCMRLCACECTHVCVSVAYRGLYVEELSEDRQWHAEHGHIKRREIDTKTMRWTDLPGQTADQRGRGENKRLLARLLFLCFLHQAHLRMTFQSHRTKWCVFVPVCVCTCVCVCVRVYLSILCACAYMCVCVCDICRSQTKEPAV